VIETKIYIGLNDATTKQQKHSTETYVDIMKSIAKDLCAFFHQESVMVTESVVNVSFIKDRINICDLR